MWEKWNVYRLLDSRCCKMMVKEKRKGNGYVVFNWDFSVAVCYFRRAFEKVLKVKFMWLALGVKSEREIKM